METEITEKNYTISEATEIYKALNKNLMEALQIFKKLYDNKSLDENDLKVLTGLDMEYKEILIIKDELAIHSETIYVSILETVFSELMEEVCLFYKSYDAEYWEPVQEDGIRLIISNGYEVSKFLALFNKFFYSLAAINQFSEMYLLAPEDKRNDFEYNYTLESINISETLGRMNYIKDVSKKIEFLKKEIIEKELTLLKISSDSKYYKKLQEYISKCQKAIEIISKQLPPKDSTAFPVIKKDTEKLTDKVPDTVTSKNPEFTTSRQVLAVYYLLNAIDRGIVNQTDRTVKARFIEFLTDKNYNNIYTALSNPFKGLENNNKKQILKDLEYVKSHFSKLGIQSIVDQIDNDIKG